MFRQGFDTNPGVWSRVSHEFRNTPRGQLVQRLKELKARNIAWWIQQKRQPRQVISVQDRNDLDTAIRFDRFADDIESTRHNAVLAAVAEAVGYKSPEYYELYERLYQTCGEKQMSGLIESLDDLDVPNVYNWIIDKLPVGWKITREDTQHLGQAIQQDNLARHRNPHIRANILSEVSRILGAQSQIYKALDEQLP